MGTADVIKNYNYAGIRQFLVFFRRYAAKFDVQKLPVLHKY